MQDTISHYFKIRQEVIAVYLFGSHAVGKERPFSDVDIGIIITHRDMSRSFDLQSQYTVELGRQLRKDLHIVILNTAGELLLKQVYQKGRLICVNDEPQLMQFKMIHFSMIAEFGYYLNMTQAGFRRRVLEEHSIG